MVKLNSKTFVIIFTFFSMLFITVAWSSFGTNLMISGESVIAPDDVPPTCGTWYLRDASLTYEEAKAQDAFINPGANETWTTSDLILSVDCTDNMECAFDHYDLMVGANYDEPTYTQSVKTDSVARSITIMDRMQNQTVCTLPVGASNPYIDKEAPTITVTNTSYNKFTYSAVDDIEVQGYMVTNSSTYPAIDDENWLSEPAEVTIDSSAAKTYYIYAKDGINVKRYSRSTYFLTKSQGANTILSTKFNDSNGVEIPATYVLNNTNMYVSATSTQPYHTPVLSRRNTGYSNITEIENGSIQTISGYAITIYSVDKANIYDITLNKQSGSGGTSTIYRSYGEGHYLDNNNGTLSRKMSSNTNAVEVPTRSGYAFVGYYTSTNGGGTRYIDGTGHITSSAVSATISNTTLYAYWVQPGLYNSSGTLIKTWAQLEALGLTKTSIETNYSYSNYKTTAGSPYKVFTDNNLSGKLVLPSTITKIGSYSFGEVTGLTSIVFTDNVKSIENGAFYQCSGLTGTLNLPSKITKIGDSAFYWCRNITGALVIPDSVTTLSSAAFQKCYGISSLVIGNGITSIPTLAFEDCTGLTSVTIPSGVTNIGNYAFRYCNYIQSITIPDSVVTIGNYAFYQCARLTSITIPSGVTSIGSYAFYNCTGLTSVTFSAPSGWFVSTSSNALSGTNVTLTNASQNATYLKSTYNTYYWTKNTGWGLYDNNNNLIKSWSELETLGLTKATIEKDYTSSNYNTETGSPYKVFTNNNLSGKLVLPPTITKIGKYAFYKNTYLTAIVIPKSVSSIYQYSFYQSTNLTSVTITGNSTWLGDYIFYQCKNLTSVVMSGVRTIGYYEFSGCTKLTSVTIPNGVTTIYGYAFDGCSELTGSLVIPNSVTSIGNYAFRNCTKLTSLTLSNNLTSIGQSAFYQDTGLTGTLNIPDSVTSIGGWAFYGCTNLTGEINIPKGVTTIGKSTFYNCGKLTGVLVIPDSVTSIGDYAFDNCTGLTSITIPNSITSIGIYAFYYCTGLTGSLVIPNSVTSIGNYAFYNCTGLTGSLVIPNSVTSIGNYAFYWCSHLTSVTIGSGVTTIGDYAFAYGRGLTSLTIGSGVTTIGNYAFYYCDDLTGPLIIPNNVTTIGNYAFNNCSNITGALTISSSVTSIGTGAFSGVGELTSISVDSNNTVYDSRNNSNAIIETATNTLILGCKNTIIPNSITGIGDYAFYKCSSSTSITIPDSVTTIGNFAFYECTGLTGDLIIPNGVTSIGRYTFYHCSRLTSITIPDSVTSIGEYAFGSCSGVTGELVIPNSVTSIGDNAFSGCSKLSSLTLGTGITMINQYAFSGCKGLTSVTIPNNVTKIGAYAFSGCTDLTSLTIGTGVTDVGNNAFQNCSSLTSLTIPSNVTTIGTNVFNNCSSLTSVTFDNPSGWFYASSPTATSGTALTLTDPTENATYLKTTYKTYYWIRN